MIYHPHSQQILGVYIASGRIHDINLARKTVKDLCHYRYVPADLGYYELKELGSKLLTPIKKFKNIALTKVEKAFNRRLSQYRMRIEHINGHLKRFRILSRCYRNRRKRFGLRVNLIAVLVNRMNLKS